MRTVHSTSDDKEIARNQVMLVGGVGSGKSTLMTTLSGRKFAYLFDPNSLAAIKHAKGIDYVEFIPEEVTDLDLGVKTLKSMTEGKAHDKSPVRPEPRLYTDWLADFIERRQARFFDQYDWICFDSATTFQDIIYDRVQFLNGRFGKHPEEADHTAQMNTFRLDMRAAATLTNLFVTAHIETQKDGLDGRIYGRIMMTGKNRLRVPGMFAHIFATEVNEEGHYVLHTRPSRMHPVVRTSIKGLQPVEDVTLDWNRPLDGQGLAKVLTSLKIHPVSAGGK